MSVHAPTLRRFAALAVAAAAVALGAPAHAWAHATLLRSDPADGTVLQQPPAHVTLQFSEPVETSLADIAVLDAKLERVDLRRMGHPQPDTLEVELPKLPRGSYLVTWRVVSADTHAVNGAFVFSIGTGAGAAAVAARGGGSQAPPESVELAFAVIRFASFALLFFCVGGAFIGAIVRDVPPSARLTLAGAAAALALVSLVGILCQGAEAGGTGFRGALDADVISDVMHSRFGQAWGIRAGIAVWLAGVLLLGPVARHVAAVLALALVPTVSLASHAEAAGTGTVFVDLVHVAAAALWAGGLAFVLVALLLERVGSRWRLAARLVPRFSAVALVAMAFVVSAGVLNAYLELRSWSALWHTSYGQLVVAKVALVLPVLALGAYNRRFAVPALQREVSTPTQQRRFTSGALVELGLVAAILGVTAALVAEPPGSAVAATPPGPVSATKNAGPFELELHVDPARVGANRIRLVAREQSGRLANLDEVRLSASLGDSGIEALAFEPRSAGRGRYVVRRAVFPAAGEWKLRVAVRRGEFDEWTTTVDVPIRS